MYEIDSNPSIGSDGTIYFGSDDKKLYAIGAGSEPWGQDPLWGRHESI